jgi:transposase-like protein
VKKERTAKCMKKECAHCLHWYDFSSELWKSMPTATFLERGFREVRRCSYPVDNFFTHQEDSDRVIEGFGQMLNKN